MGLRHGMVQSLKNENEEWNIRLINDVFSRDSAKEICRMFWANNNNEDKLIWVGNNNGEFFVKSFHWLENWDRETDQS